MAATAFAAASVVAATTAGPMETGLPDDLGLDIDLDEHVIASLFSDPSFLDTPNLPPDVLGVLPKFNLRMGMFQGTTRVDPGNLMLDHLLNNGARLDGIPRLPQAKMRAMFEDLRAMCVCPVFCATDGMFVDSVRARVSGSQDDIVVHSEELTRMIDNKSSAFGKKKVAYTTQDTLSTISPIHGGSYDPDTDPCNEVLVQQGVFNKFGPVDEMLEEEEAAATGPVVETIPTPVRIHAINIRGRFPGTSNSVSLYIFDTGMVKVSGGTSDGQSRITGGTEYERFITEMVIDKGMNACSIFRAHLGPLPPLCIRMINAVAKLSEQTRVAINEPSVFGLFRDIMTSEANFEGTVFKSVSLARTSTSQLVIRMDDAVGAVRTYGPGTIKISRTGGSVWFAGFRSVDSILSAMNILDDLLKRMSGGVFTIPLYLSPDSTAGMDGVGGAGNAVTQVLADGGLVTSDTDPVWLEYRVRSNLVRTTQRLARTYNKRGSYAGAV